MELPFVHDKTIRDESIYIGSEAWYKWLETTKSFRYQPLQNSQITRAVITVRNRNADYWYAYRTTNSKQRTFYLGKTSDLTYEKLQDAVDELSLPDFEYWRLVSERKTTTSKKTVQVKTQTVQNIFLETYAKAQQKSEEYQHLQNQLAELTEANLQLQLQLQQSQEEAHLQAEKLAMAKKELSARKQLENLQVELSTIQARIDLKSTGYNDKSAKRLFLHLQKLSDEFCKPSLVKKIKEIINS
jgi:hypothetical protein